MGPYTSVGQISGLCRRIPISRRLRISRSAYSAYGWPPFVSSSHMMTPKDHYKRVYPRIIFSNYDIKKKLITETIYFGLGFLSYDKGYMFRKASIPNAHDLSNKNVTLELICRPRWNIFQMLNQLIFKVKLMMWHCCNLQSQIQCDINLRFPLHFINLWEQRYFKLMTDK